MRLTSHTDYALRILMALGAVSDRLMTIEELAARHRISRNHLMKVAQSLVGLGLVKSVRGRRGGLMLGRLPSEIRMGTVIRALETDCELVACLGTAPETCVFSGVCRLTGALRQAMTAFFAELDQLTLADLVANRQAVRARLQVAA